MEVRYKKRKTCLNQKNNYKASIRGQLSHTKAKTRVAGLCQTELEAVYLDSVNINLIMKALTKFIKIE